MDEAQQTQAAVNEAHRRAVVEKMWLNYFNNGLLEKGLITPQQHQEMKLQIKTRKSKSYER